MVPAVADIAIEPEACVRGSGCVPPAALDSPTRYRPCAGIEPDSVVTCQLPVAPDEWYCTDHPSTLTAASLRFANSMKSFVSVAPLLPPPPYTSLMTSVEDGVADAAAALNTVAAIAAVAASTTTVFDPCHIRAPRITLPPMSFPRPVGRAIAASLPAPRRFAHGRPEHVKISISRGEHAVGPLPPHVRRPRRAALTHSSTPAGTGYGGTGPGARV